ncbi:MAG: hypothetical protein JJT85_03775 [Chromatiales bacterium]|nr:hypothetical protein [Chromatiales bacterium]
MPEADAPGKLVISGEYAVLHGAAALAVAVDARVRVRLFRLKAGPSELAAGDAPEACFCCAADGSLQWVGESPGPNGGPLESVLAALAASGQLSAAEALPACRVEIRSESFQTTLADGTRSKLGLGSSAAVTVALTGALLALLGRRLPPQGMLALCLDAHRRLQGGLGSGIDVAASLHGGVVARDVSGGILPVSWPDPLRMLAIWTGAGASTTMLVGRYEAWQQREPGAFSAHLGRMKATAERVQQAWRAARLGALLPALADYDAALLQLDEAAGIGIYTPEHRRLRELARAQGLVYKPSGAGGGDFGVVFGADPQALGRLRAQCAAEGLVTMDVPPCGRGLTVS